MKLKKLKLNELSLEKTEMKKLLGGSYSRCACGCGELPSGYTNAAGATQEAYDETWK